ncbi:GNAT family N-acetyltransferase [Paucihalobacter sp.]|uniref:GNAT family N-acetyltransferase n=1 Tax=Paucihalobacter sp. TaxID=2850405 RepID=UPI002FE34D04
MKQSLLLLNHHHEPFFNILPEDWQEAIVPHWNHYQNDSKIYVLKDANKIVAGGIVFSTCPPDMINHKEEAEWWFENGYLYIGFLFVAESHRNQKLGSQWIEALKDSTPNRGFWLVIEEDGLGNFYEKHQFKMEKIIQSSTTTEWLYAFKPDVSD